MADRALRVALPPDVPRARYALETLLHLLGVSWQEIAPGAEADLAYGDCPRAQHTIPAGPQDGWDDPRPLHRRDGELPILHRPGGSAQAHTVGTSELGFDMLYATYACLAGVWESVDPKDEVGCPIAAEGWLAANGLLHEPIVHKYAKVLAGVLATSGFEAHLPEPMLVLTHDVDFNFGHLFWRRESWSHLRREVRARRSSSFRRAAGLVRRTGRQIILNADPNDRWAEWAALAGEYHGRPAYFVASYGLFDDGSSRHDPPYDIRHPEVASTLRRIAAEGAEIGVHFSLEARGSTQRLREEVERLELVLGAPVRSARHHWWALGEPATPTLRMHTDAGIEVDCSIGFNDRTGFRRGIAYPFRPFDPVRAEPLDLWELPTTAMDIGLFKPGSSWDEAQADLASLLAATRAYGGFLVLNWHGHALNPRVLDGAGRGLVSFLETVAREPIDLSTPLEAIRSAEERLGAPRTHPLRPKR